MLRVSLIIPVLVVGLMLTSAQAPSRVNARLFYSLTQKHPGALILDVRPAEKFAQYRIKEAIPLPEKAQLIELADDLTKTDTIFVYCEKELRSGPAAHVLDSLGFTNVYELKGGLISWRRNDLPLDNTPLKQ
ncbi:rhodanese-like domain-containing protein [Carboxylicivirga sp. RSCT41]|uniref:rhodanese-like domain-containing protein n=1 Tax=Carboxylicivirga agarovorans TaxID=3417570 RepID=UPI003D327A80